MQLQGTRILLTGASGGIGSALARELSRRGARLLLTGRNRDKLEQVRTTLSDGAEAHSLPADILDAAQRRELVGTAIAQWQGLDLLINVAGVNRFGAFADEPDQQTEAILRSNLLAPMLLCKALLPTLLAQSQARIVNIGSAFGSIGFPFFASYSASKFGLRGFSEALRRELADTRVGVSYFAPRATRTPINTDAIMEMGKATGMAVDEPDDVARQLVRGIEQERDELFIGAPERLFARVNGILPALVSRGLRKQTRLAKPFATGSTGNGSPTGPADTPQS